MDAETDAGARVKVVETDRMTGWDRYLDNMKTTPWSGTFTREEADASVKWREEHITRRYAYTIVPLEPYMTDNDAALKRHAERHGHWPVTDCGDVDCREAAGRLLHEEFDRRFAARDAGEADVHG